MSPILKHPLLFLGPQREDNSCMRNVETQAGGHTGALGASFIGGKTNLLKGRIQERGEEGWQ